MKNVEREEVDEVLNIDVQTASLMSSLAREVEISIRFKHLEANRSSRDSRFVTVRYPISIYIGEAINDSKGNAIVPFTIEAKTDPDIANFTLSGDAHIRGPPEEIESWIVPDKDKAPKIWTKIYQESVAMLTIMAKFIDVPPPPPPSSSKE